MATRRPVPPPEAPILTIDQKRRRIERLQKCIQELEVFEPEKVQKRYREPEVMRLEAAIDQALASTFGHNTSAYNRYKDAASLDHGAHTLRMTPAFGRGPQIDYDAQEAHEARRHFAEGKVQSIMLLGQAISTLNDEIAEQEQDSPNADTPIVSRAHSRKVFIVHGREDGPREAVARFLVGIGFEPIILHEQANKGRTVIEKVEAHSEVGFAVVLLTPDDEGCLKGEEPAPRARQNVLLELGYFIGKLGRANVCVLQRGEVEIPSDWRGVVDEPFDEAGAWQKPLARELQAAGFEIDWNKVMR